MSLHVLVSGPLFADPQRRVGAKGVFATGTVHVRGDEPTLVNTIAFQQQAEQLLDLVKGDAIAVSGPARLTSWTGRDGAEKHGLSVIAQQIAALQRRPSAATPGLRAKRRSDSVRQRGVTGPPLPADRVDDLYADGLAT